ncbi:serpin family protein [Egbenema bharatensis]|uniref:serpin family protein n=1 Tax=Egbenema bharatensis TaxID=3463334 RepID=UPI003A887E56
MARFPVRCFTIAFAGWLALSGLAACGSINRNSAIAQPPPATPSPTMSPTPAVNPQLIAADNQFGFKLFSQLIQQDSEQNLMMSPTSVAIALSMLYNGASGETQQQIATTLELHGMSLEDLNQANADLKNLLENADPQVKLAIANSLWGNQEVAFKPDFIQRIQTFYDAEVETLDFTNPSVVNRINDWVDRNTEGKIPTILDEVRPDDILFLINAVYFKGEWQQAFDQANTSDRPFTLPDGSTKNHPLMSQSGNYLYQETDEFQAVSLPYGEGRLSMYVFLPQADVPLTQFSQELLSADNWDTAMTRFTRRDGTVELPRFKYEYATRLNDALKALGMPMAFDPDVADLTGLTDQDSFVNEVRHKTFIEVNEEGTEAAAVTSIGIRATSVQIPTEPFVMTVDRPFFYAIRDNESGAILFMGSVVNPE